MTLFKKLLSALTVLAMTGTFTAPVLAADPAEIQFLEETAAKPSRDEASAEIKQAGSKLIYAYGNNDEAEISKELDTLKSLSPDDWYPIYQKTLDTWSEIETKMPENIGVAPDGIQNPENHCFIVLGYALNADGTMTDELVGRLEVAKASLDKYPQAKVLVTGGVEKNGWTEGARMHDWLVANGIADDRIYIENKAPDTAGNATNSFAILYNEPRIKTVSLISSQYHIKRGSILYYAESLLKARELGCEPITFLINDNAGWYREDKTSEPMTSKVNSLYSIFRVPKVEPPKLSEDTVLTGIDLIDTTSRNFTRTAGEPLSMMVKTLDTKNDNLDVTDWCVISPYDPDKIGEQIITVSFTYEGKTVTASVTVKVEAAEGASKTTLRVYNPNSGEHFFTLDAREKDYLVKAGWKDEGEDWTVPETSETPVYRVYNPNAGDHHYTTDKKERDVLVSLGWKDEGISWYAADDGMPVYRAYNPNARAGAHHFTTNKKEYDVLVNLGWKEEGTAWNALAN